MHNRAGGAHPVQTSHALLLQDSLQRAGDASGVGAATRTGASCVDAPSEARADKVEGVRHGDRGGAGAGAGEEFDPDGRASGGGVRGRVGAAQRGDEGCAIVLVGGVVEGGVGDYADDAGGVAPAHRACQRVCSLGEYDVVALISAVPARSLPSKLPQVRGEANCGALDG